MKRLERLEAIAVELRSLAGVASDLLWGPTQAEAIERCPVCDREEQEFRRLELVDLTIERHYHPDGSKCFYVGGFYEDVDFCVRGSDRGPLRFFVERSSSED